MHRLEQKRVCQAFCRAVASDTSSQVYGAWQWTHSGRPLASSTWRYDDTYNVRYQVFYCCRLNISFTLPTPVNHSKLFNRIGILRKNAQIYLLIEWLTSLHVHRSSTAYQQQLETVHTWTIPCKKVDISPLESSVSRLSLAQDGSLARTPVHFNGEIFRSSDITPDLEMTLVEPPISVALATAADAMSSCKVDKYSNLSKYKHHSCNLSY